jgi:alanyl-tRNA synthetase
MTERLYYNNSYIHEFSANVLERLTAADHPAVVLDRTCFYPTGGGQPNDTGFIEGVSVVDVFSREGDSSVVHVLAEPVSAAEVTCSIDWARRFDLMQHHTGQHILSQAFVQAADAHTVGFHLSAENVTIDLNRTGLSESTVAEVEDLANQIIYEDRTVTARIVDPADTAGVRLRKLPEHLHTVGLRIIDIDNFDVTACGGTHVARTGEIGIIKVLRLEKRGEKSRVEFRCGSRALRDYRAKNALIYQLTAALTCAMDELPLSIGRLQENLKTLQSDLKSANQMLLDYEAVQLLAQTDEYHGVKIIRMSFASRDAGDVRLLASRLTETPGVIALLGTSGERASLVFARSADLPDDMNALLKDTLARIEAGRGGGQPGMAQGSGQADAAQLNAALDEAAQTVEKNHS